jgi:hypothetical protein
MTTQHAGMASGVLTTGLHVGNAIGVTITGAIFYGTLQGEARLYRDALAYSLIYLIAASLLLVAIVQLLPRTDDRQCRARQA